MMKQPRTPSPAEQLEQAITRAAWKQYEAERAVFLEELRRVKRQAAGATAHGTRSRYKSGCPCDECREANNEYMKQYRHDRGISKAYRKFRREQQ